MRPLKSPLYFNFMHKKSKNSILNYLFLPHYNELSLFTMSFISILLILINGKPWHWKIQNGYLNRESIIFLIVILPFIVGMLLCLYHAFSKRPKKLFEKKLMLFFAVILNGFSGIWGGTYIIINSMSWGLSFFPLWNIINGFILLAGLRGSAINEDCIDDRNVSLKRLLSSSVIISALFYVCHFYFGFVWAITLSICVTWATNLNNLTDSLIERAKLNIFQV